MRSQSFSNEELNLLNKGLNFVPSASKDSLDEVIVSVESAIQYLPNSSKGFAREAVRKQISKNVINHKHNSQRKTQNIIKGLREKECFYLKADKGNKVVILDKQDYFQRVDNLIGDGPYRKLTRNPLPKMVSQVKSILNKCPNLITAHNKYKLQISKL